MVAKLEMCGFLHGEMGIAEIKPCIEIALFEKLRWVTSVNEGERLSSYSGVRRLRFDLIKVVDKNTALYAFSEISQ